ncbi:hypothetical protein JCM8097_007192 [Rhodosporidiobolus ruineniae]
MPRFVKIDNSLTVASPGYGAMGLAFGYGPTDDAQSKDVLRKAIEMGCTFWNTARMYGPNEKLLGEVLREGNNREKVVLTTKWGIKFGAQGMEVDGSPAFARECLEQSTADLGSSPDIFLLHRIDKATPVEESMQAMDNLRREGKVKYIGLSAMSATSLRRAAKVAQVDFVEMEFSPFETSIETNGVLDACKELNVKVIAYSPLGGGFLTGRFRDFQSVTGPGDVRSSGRFPRFNEDVWQHNFRLVEALEQIAARKGITAGQLSLAWVMQVHGDLIIPIPGTKSLKYLEQNFAAGDITPTSEEMAAVRQAIDENPLKGDKYSEEMKAFVDED